jgi:uncharacterized membrane protein
MNQKQIGIILIVIGILMSIFVFYVKVENEQHIALLVSETGTCFLKDGTCMHNQGQILYILGWVLSASIIILGIYLIFFDKTQKVLAEHQVKVSRALEEAKKQDKEKDEFKAFLSGFNEDEQKILLAIREQEGIQQSTLRFKIGMSKTSLSLLLKSLEDRGIISRKESGKTNQVFLKKKF